MSFHGSLLSSGAYYGREYYSAGLIEPWTPEFLFGLGEVGAWYDPSDLTTLFQDTAGATPVTTAGQRVALMLDKSRGLTLGPELITNGDFSGGATGWTLGANWSVSGGAASKTSGAGNNLSQNIATVAGRSYLVTFVVSGLSGSSQVQVGTSATVPTLTAGSFSAILLATASSSTFVIIGGTFSALSIDNISVRELPGNHATQSVLAQQPLYEIDAGGKPHLFFDGIDDGMVTSTITPGADKVSVFAGVRKLSDAATGMLLEHSASLTTNNGSFFVLAPNGAGLARYEFGSKGTVAATAASASTFAAPITNVVTGLGDIAGDTATLRVNGAQVNQSAGDQGTGNFLAYPLYLGRRGGASLPLNGHIYGLIVRFAVANLAAAQIAATERWMAQKTGVTLA